MPNLFTMTLLCIRANVLVASNFQNCLHLRNGNHRGYAAKDQVTEEEQTNGSREKADFNPCWTVIAPGRWQEVTGQSGCNNYKAFKPHPNVDHDGDKECPPNAAANAARPKYLRADYIAKHHPKI